ncbi:hypothetical protein [Georgenia sp. SUBG003]|uniref:hypothetical protein n=1 Tax=Georgenia sp. SUBG003 TaxID=1497974 RepID=UPI00069343F9
MAFRTDDGAVSGTSEGSEAATPPELRAQLLATEHWSLLASRSLAWQEAFARTGMYLATLSGSVVALALVAQADRFGHGFRLAAVVVLPVVLFVGVTTFVRLGASNYHDAMCVAGMNRIRHAYVELAPELAPLFVMSTYDDARGVGVTMGVPPGRSHVPHLLSATPFVVAVVNSVVAGSAAALAGGLLGLPDEVAVVVAVAGALASVAAHAWSAGRAIRKEQRSLHVLFPSPEISVSSPGRRP